MEEKQVLIDYAKCIGCKHCEIACALEHSGSKELFSAILEDPPPVKRIFVDVSSDLATFPSKCRHCELPFCVSVCPTGAMKKEETGLVLVDESLCIGCGMCGMACPFGVIIYAPRKEGKRVSLKCDGCLQRISEGNVPACVEACKTGALSFVSPEEFSKEKRAYVSERIAFPTPFPETPFGVTKEVSIWRDTLKTLSELKTREV